jgi:lysophospholipase L1-like esterase
VPWPAQADCAASFLEAKGWANRFAALQRDLESGDPALLWMGDSITQAWENAGPEDWRNFRPVWDHYYAPRRAINLGFAGDGTPHLLWRINNWRFDRVRPRAAVVMIGTNNFGGHRFDAAATEGGIAAILAALAEKLPQMRVLLLGVLPSIRDDWTDAQTASLNAGLAARYGGSDKGWVVYRDLGGLFLRGGHVDPQAFIDPRLTPPRPALHPTAQSQARMAAAIEPILSRMLGERPGWKKRVFGRRLA